MKPQIQSQQVVELLSQFIRIDSVNPTLVEGGKGEAEISAFVARLMENAGFETRLQEAAPGRHNVIARLMGSGGGRSLAFNAHMDVVSVDGMDEPFKPRLDGERLYGRGAYDTKSGLAAAISLMLACKEQHIPLKGDLILTATVDEELASLGTQALVKDFSADGCLVLEPTEETIGVAHGGFIYFDIDIVGVAAHGSMPQFGVDAILKAGPLLVELERLNRRLQSEKVFKSTLSPQSVSPSLHAGFIRGGREISSYPDHCWLQVERRTVPGESDLDCEAEINAILKHLTAQDVQFKAACRPELSRPPWQTQAGPLLASVDHACIQEFGVAQHAVFGFWTDACLITQAGIPSLLFGPRGGGAHALQEWVEIPSLLACTRVLADAVVRFCD